MRTNPPEPDPADLLTVEAAHREFPYIPTATFRDWISTRKIDSYRFGRRVLVSRRDIIARIVATRRSRTSEITAVELLLKLACENPEVIAAFKAHVTGTTETK